MFEHLVSSLSGTLVFANLVAMVVSTAAGIMVGALPGLSASMGVALLIPFTFSMDPLTGLLCMAGMYNGAIYGGSIAAILINIPGTPGAVVTTFDGNAMAKKGEGRYALETAVICSTVGGAASALALMFIAPYLAALALKFGPAEYFWISVLGLSTIASFLSGSTVKGLFCAFAGLFISTVGIDQISGVFRFTFDNMYLMEGFPEIVVLIGLYSIPEVFTMLEDVAAGKTAAANNLMLEQARYKEEKRWTFRQDFKASIPTWTRSSIIGIVIGMIPGAGSSIAAFISYKEAKRKSKNPDNFGKGEVEGIRASETANNAVTASAMIPMLTFGIPGNVVTAIMVGGLLIHGLHPGPNLFIKEPRIVYGLMWGMLLTNFIMLALGYFGSRFFAKCLKMPTVILAAAIGVLSTVGTYSLNNSMFDVYSMLCFGVVGLVMRKMKLPIAPAVLGIILGPLAETELRRALMIADSPIEIFTRPLSFFLFLLTLLSLFYPVFKARLAARGTKA